MKTLLMIGSEVDRLLRYPVGRSERLARRGLMPHIVLPDGEIRFHHAAIEKMISAHSAAFPLPAGKGIRPENRVVLNRVK